MTRAAAPFVLAAALLSACTEKSEAPAAQQERLPTSARPVAPKVASSPRSRALPTAAEAEFALTLGKSLFTEAKLEEAEAQLKVAAAGGRSEADALLLKVQAEIEARRRLAEARQKYEARDWAGAEAALGGIGNGTSLRQRADELAQKIAAVKQAEADEMKARIERAIDREGDAGVGEGSKERTR